MCAIRKTAQDTDVKKTDLYKNERLKVVAQMKHAAGAKTAPGATPLVDRKEQRRLDAERGLVPFAVKIPSDLASRLRDVANDRQVSLNELVSELLTRALDQA